MTIIEKKGEKNQMLTIASRLRALFASLFCPQTRLFGQMTG
jgi:hypothetical protein